MALLSNAAVLLGKELRTEYRSRELLTTTVVFILLIFMLFSITFHPTTTESQQFGPGLLWVAFLFAASSTKSSEILRFSSLFADDFICTIATRCDLPIIYHSRTELKACRSRRHTRDKSGEPDTKN